MSPAEPIGALITHARLDHGWSQLRLAERLCGLSGATTITRHEISRWEREERVPTGYWLGWLAVALELPIGQLERSAASTRRRRARPWQAAGWVPSAPGVYARAS